MKNAISINLDADRFDRAGDRESLGDLLERAAKISFPTAEAAGDLRDEMRWISRLAIRAVCAEILRTGGVPLPMAVRFAERNEAMTTRPQSSNVIQFESRPA